MYIDICNFCSFIVIFRARNYNKVADDRDQETSTSRVTDRTQLHRILTEVGLNPSDYIFSPLPEDSLSGGTPSNHTSAFSTYPSQQKQQDGQLPLKPQSQSLFTSGRPLSYAQQPPPPPPSQTSRSQPPPSNSNPPPSSSQAPIRQQQDPPPSSQQGSSVPPFFLNLNQSAPNTQKTTSQPPPDMSQHAFSPRRSPPPPPTHSNLSAEHYLRQINSHDTPPVKVVKPSTQNVVYKKEIRIRYLQPPTPPPPAPIIIREKHIPPHPPETVNINSFV